MNEGVDHDDLMGAEESGEEDKKEVCIQVKLGKEEKTEAEERERETEKRDRESGIELKKKKKKRSL